MYPLNFKQWLSEWEGFGFLQEPEIENGPAYAERGIRSKNKGPGRKDPDPRDQELPRKRRQKKDGKIHPRPNMSDKIDKDWGFGKKDKHGNRQPDLLIAASKMMKKMNK